MFWNKNSPGKPGYKGQDKGDYNTINNNKKIQIAVMIPLMIPELLALERAIPINTIQAMPTISIMAVYRYQVQAAR